MKMNTDPEWIKRMADLEDGCDVSVGGLMHAELLKQLCVSKAPPPEECAQCHGTGEILPAGPSDAPVEFCDACLVGARAENAWWKDQLAACLSTANIATRWMTHEQKDDFSTACYENCAKCIVEKRLANLAPAAEARRAEIERPLRERVARLEEAVKFFLESWMEEFHDHVQTFPMEKFIERFEPVTAEKIRLHHAALTTPSAGWWTAKLAAAKADAVRLLPCSCKQVGTNSEDAAVITCERCFALSGYEAEVARKEQQG